MAERDFSICSTLSSPEKVVNRRVYLFLASLDIFTYETGIRYLFSILIKNTQTVTSHGISERVPGWNVKGASALTGAIGASTRATATSARRAASALSRSKRSRGAAGRKRAKIHQ
ncbi:hypothetical protein [Bacillus sp. V59.32b]|uniref:hypothetical protein n=1 Tax=Bacillus sp. V59.32b TaxID=1758642 RepID=UPI0010591F74|nr:hypothetical protein [Bacillus sp. V59.32b]